MLLIKFEVADVSLNGPFKSKIKSFFEDWINNENMEFTKGGNPKQPSIDTYLNWIARAWDEIDSNSIIKSFKVCGIGLNKNGSEDKLIHYIKNITGGLEALENARKNNEINKISTEINEITLENNYYSSSDDSSHNSIEFI